MDYVHFHFNRLLLLLFTGLAVVISQYDCKLSGRYIYICRNPIRVKWAEHKMSCNEIHANENLNLVWPIFFKWTDCVVAWFLFSVAISVFNEFPQRGNSIKNWPIWTVRNNNLIESLGKSKTKVQFLYNPFSFIPFEVYLLLLLWWNEYLQTIMLFLFLNFIYKQPEEFSRDFVASIGFCFFRNLLGVEKFSFSGCAHKILQSVSRTQARLQTRSHSNRL